MKTTGLLILIGAGVVLGFLLRREQASQIGDTSRVVVEPAQYDVPDPVLATGTAELQVVVRNLTSRALMVKRAYSDCSCAEVTAQEGGALSGLSLPPNGRVPLAITVSPSPRSFGRQSFGLVVEAHDPDEKSVVDVATSDISFRVSGGMRAFPDKLAVVDVEPDTPLERDIDLYDAYPGDGWRIDSIEVSHTEMIQVERISDFERIAISRSDEMGFNPRSDFQHRGRLRVRVQAPSAYGESFSAWIRLFPEFNGQSLDPVTIPIDGTTRPPQFDFRPRSLLVYLADKDEAVRRYLRCYSSDVMTDQLIVTSAPEFASVRIANDEEAPGWTVEVTIAVAATDASRIEGMLEFGLAGTPSVCVSRVPVTVVVRAGVH